MQKRRLPMFNLTRGPVKAAETFASCVAGARWRSPLRRVHNQAIARAGKLAAGSVGVITRDGVNVTSTKSKSALSIIEDSPLRC